MREVELTREQKIKNRFIGGGERLVGDISKGIEKWDNWGKAEGMKGYLQRLAKTGVSLAMIGAVSGLSVEGLAKMGIGTASALGAGLTSYLGRKVALGTGISTIMAGVSDKNKKWVSGALMAGSVGLALAGGGLVAGGAIVASSAIGLTLAQITKKYDKKIAGNMEKVKRGELNLDTLADDIGNMEREMEAALKQAEKARVWGKIREGAIAIAGSMATLEVIGVVHDIGHTNQEAKKNEADLKTNLKMPKPPGLPSDYEKIAHNPPHNLEESTQPHALSSDLVVHKGEGVEHTFIRQIEHNPQLAKDLGYKGDINDAKALHIFAGREAHIVATQTGYVDNAGHEVRVMAPDKVGYEIKMEDGHPVVLEKTIGGETLGTYHQGDEFGANPHNQFEKVVDTTHHEPVHNESAHGVVEKTVQTSQVEHATLTSSTPEPVNTTEPILKLTDQEIKLAAARENVLHKYDEHAIQPTTDSEVHTKGMQALTGNTDKQNSFSGGISPEQQIPPQPILDYYAPVHTENPFGLDWGKMSEVFSIYKENLHHLLTDDNKIDFWKTLQGTSAHNTLSQTQHSENLNYIFSYLGKVHEVTGLEPKTGIVVGVGDEKVSEYVERALEFAASKSPEMLAKLKIE